MSRIGKNPIPIPKQVTVKVENGVIYVEGKKGVLKRNLPPNISVEISDNIVRVVRYNDSKESKEMHGLTRVLIANMIKGVSEGFQKSLEINGIGYKAVMEGEKLKLYLGFSHPVEFEAPKSIKIEVQKNIINVSGCDKELVGIVASQIRRIRPPDPYKVKGIKYTDEIVRKKVGKAAG